MSWMVYGGYGYTGRLIVEEAVRRGERPVVAGRDAARVSAVASAWGLEGRAFALERPQDVDEGLRGIRAVVHAAGPFSASWRPMLDGCLRGGVDYLDITGEIEVFEGVFARAEEVLSAGRVVVPGVGFDVVPTDCVAKMLAEAVPGASRLELAFGGGAGVSHGTALTALEGLHKGGAERRGGRLVVAAIGARSRTVTVAGRERRVVSIPWGDLATAWRSTSIPNIVTYTRLPEAVMPWLRAAPVWSFFLRMPWLRGVLRRQIDARVTGPGAAAREDARSWVWGRVEADDGRWATVGLTAPDGYTFTSRSAVEAVMSLGGIEPGAMTPSLAFGSRFVERISGVTVEALETGRA